ncbi:hypothetical protein B0H14DRAFT_2614055 [Mycena olivaceomarginata]|nr:hypothetical protein B0H14DRAFT_2614055 [Mycena olivaceomarginata]
MCGRSRSPTKAACGWGSMWTKTTCEWASVSSKTTLRLGSGLDKADLRVVLDTDKDAGDQARLFPKWACDAGRGAGCCVTPAGCEIGARRAAVSHPQSPSYGFFKVRQRPLSNVTQMSPLYAEHMRLTHMVIICLGLCPRGWSSSSTRPVSAAPSSAYSDASGDRPVILTHLFGVSCSLSLLSPFVFVRMEQWDGTNWATADLRYIVADAHIADEAPDMDAHLGWDFTPSNIKWLDPDVSSKVAECPQGISLTEKNKLYAFHRVTGCPSQFPFLRQCTGFLINLTDVKELDRERTVDQRLSFLGRSTGARNKPDAYIPGSFFGLSGDIIRKKAPSEIWRKFGTRLKIWPSWSDWPKVGKFWKKGSKFPGIPRSLGLQYTTRVAYTDYPAVRSADLLSPASTQGPEWLLRIDLLSDPHSPTPVPQVVVTRHMLTSFLCIPPLPPYFSASTFFAPSFVCPPSSPPLTAAHISIQQSPGSLKSTLGRLRNGTISLSVRGPHRCASPSSAFAAHLPSPTYITALAPSPQCYIWKQSAGVEASSLDKLPVIRLGCRDRRMCGAEPMECGRRPAASQFGADGLQARVVQRTRHAAQRVRIRAHPSPKRTV